MQYRNSEILLKTRSPFLQDSPEWLGTTLALRASLAKPLTLQDPEIGGNAPGFASSPLLRYFPRMDCYDTCFASFARKAFNFTRS